MLSSSKLVTGILVLFIAAALLAGCGSPQSEQTVAPPAGEMPPEQGGGGKAILTSQEWMPQPGDKTMTRGEVIIEESGVLPSTGDTAGYSLYLSGTLPTPCHKLRVVVSEPDVQGQITVEVYSVADPNEMCVQVLGPFAAEVPLPAYLEGETTVVVNGQPLQ